MIFLKQLKYEFQDADRDFKKVTMLKEQLKEFITSELKSHYSKKFMQEFSKINFFLWAPNSNNPDPKELQELNYYNDALNQTLNLIDKLLLNIEEYKKPDYIYQEYIYGDKAGRDINKAGQDITFGNKTTFSPELNTLKEQLSEGVDNIELKNELISIVDDINKHQNNKEKRTQLVNKLWERGSQFMTILGPFAPYLFGLQ